MYTYKKESYTSSLDEFINLVELKAKTFKPFGEKVSEYRLENEDDSIVYEYYRVCFIYFIYILYHFNNF